MRIRWREGVLPLLLPLTTGFIISPGTSSQVGGGDDDDDDDDDDDTSSTMLLQRFLLFPLSCLTPTADNDDTANHGDDDRLPLPP